jgi:hypothetical protein
MHRFRLGSSVVLIVAVMTALLGCAPVIETAVRDRELSVEGVSRERIAIVLDTSRLERTSDAADLARLKDSLERELASSGVFRQYRVVIDAPSADHEPVRATVALTRLDYVKQGMRFPPAPPLELACLAPVVAPMLFERNYLRLEVTAQAELLVQDREGTVTGRTFVSESATGRADFFASGEGKAATVLQDIAFRNFSGQVVRELLFLTR